MAANVDFKVDLFGDKELAAFFDELKTSSRNRIVRPAMREAIKPITKKAKELLKSRRRSGQLAKSIGVKFKTFARGGVVYAALGPRSGFKANYNGKQINPTQYAHLIERGSVNKAATPFLRPALDSSRSTFTGIMRRRVVIELNKEVDRLAKKHRTRKAKK